ncbi:class I SAM-dependent methyltransferase [Aurantimonas sp. A2-1-M11]|uniref:class I SAM-dependent methyltransferase n=1 Tax=Aurantimonas sp. A2-1-M11 TaxID=3113712 RepID=UPI002F92BCC1
MQFSDFDFLDFGCSNGGSIKFAQSMFGGLGLGLDADPRKVERACAAGYNAIVQDVTRLDPRTMGTVRYVIMSHFLEHLPSASLAEKCILSACKVADEFVFVQQPYFDADGYLFEHGLKLYWSHWRGHTLHMTMLQLQSAFEKARCEGLCGRYLIGRRFPILDSSAKEVHRLSSPIDQVTFDPKKHEDRPNLSFTTPVFRELFGLALRHEDVNDAALVKILKNTDIVFDSASTFHPDKVPILLTSDNRRINNYRLLPNYFGSAARRLARLWPWV